MSLIPDYTRWNRAGLTHFDYVDGNAALWLEELRLAMTALYARGADIDDRSLEALRDLFLDEEPKFRRDMADVAKLRRTLPWQRLKDAVPEPLADPDPETGETHKLETRGQRTARLVAQYDARPVSDYAWEVMRAFARALHVTSGHLNAHVNEGYLRTATQWDNLRRLASMVNYQPTPAASASALVGLSLKDGLGAVEVPAGLAMKHQPAKGQPLIFETSAKLNAHPALNAARVEGWDYNPRRLPPFAQSVTWHVTDKTPLSAGDNVIVSDGEEHLAMTVSGVVRDDDAMTAQVTFQLPPLPPLKPPKGARPVPSNPIRDKFIEVQRRLDQLRSAFRPETTPTVLLLEPAELLIGQRRESSKQKAIVPAVPMSLTEGDLIRLKYEGERYVFPVLDYSDNTITIRTGLDLQGEFEIWAMSPVAKANEDSFFTGSAVSNKMFFNLENSIRILADVSATVEVPRRRNTGRKLKRYPKMGFVNVADVDDIWAESTQPIGYIFSPSFDVEIGWIFTGEEEKIMATHKVEKPVLDGNPKHVVAFSGKPPKSLQAGSSFVMRHHKTGVLSVRNVVATRIDKDVYHILFDKQVLKPHQRDFIGPMKTALNPVGWERNPLKLPSTSDLTLCDIPLAAAEILRPGRQAIICAQEDSGLEDVQAVLTTITPKPGDCVDLEFTATGDISQFTIGETLLRLNTAQVTHGEAKGPKTLGSGDGEVPRQVFTLQVKDISHIPSALSETGVIPALDITVDNELWGYSDYTDPAADGSKTWSSTLGEDGYLRIHFRRRLPTGMNNVNILRHRVGTGSRGSAIPPGNFTKPMKKSPFVEAVHQPFATSGGADREPVASLREAAPSRLSANGRAVSLQDFERVTARQATIWRARATEINTGTRTRKVVITVVPAGGAPLPPPKTDVYTDLLNSVEPRAIPGVDIAFDSYQSILLQIAASVRVDLQVHDRTEMKAACEAAIRERFDLQMRDFGQPAYVSEIMAALEAVPGVETAIVSLFDYSKAPDIDEPNTVEVDGMYSTIFPRRKQVAHVGPLTIQDANAIDITVEGLV